MTEATDSLFSPGALSVFFWHIHADTVHGWACLSVLKPRCTWSKVSLSERLLASPSKSIERIGLVNPLGKLQYGSVSMGTHVCVCMGQETWYWTREAAVTRVSLLNAIMDSHSHSSLPLLLLFFFFFHHQTPEMTSPLQTPVVKPGAVWSARLTLISPSLLKPRVLVLHLSHLVLLVWLICPM